MNISGDNIYRKMITYIIVSEGLSSLVVLIESESETGLVVKMFNFQCKCN